MNKDELLKIYSAYLPYGLQLQHKYEKAKHSGETLLRSWVKPLEPLDLGCLFPHRKDSFDWKAILYDLSYLTKEIEHEGERIIPMVYFIKKTSLFDLSKCTFEVYEDDGEVYVNAHDGDRVIDSIFYDGNIFWSSKLLDIHEGYRPANPQHTWQEMLLHLHFNVFNLPESEYINKATLTNK
ncbi:hypothetical protein [Chryseobacterium sp. WX]|uniref:hypothetical protein n=1 Tax=Chryseobacterium sp. WX TaxID=3031803 RepID=UPI0024099273|nr:hypothetical protein [Chryseobacterium sp. WX]WFB67049.1 hypothetical protein PZ898_20395 [Chryseobacterium sp. WX]